MSMMMNKGDKIHCKSVTTQVFKILLVEIGTAISKAKGSIDHIIPLENLPLYSPLKLL